MESNRMIGGRYELRQLIGRGGMAEVHIGNDTRLNRIVAIKILRQDLARDPIFQTRFRREAQAAANLNHPAIVAVYDTGEETVKSSDGTQIQVPYIVMEYVEGHTVRELLTDGNPVPINEALEIVSGVLDALEYAHHQNLVHRDIKPGNVMITTTGKIKVMDFGIARALTDSQATMTQTDAVVGTAQYLSPEQARGEQVDARSDLYSTGCLLFELLTGVPPFKGDSAVAVAFQHVSQLPRVPSSIAPDIPEALDRVVMKALAKDRDERYPDAAHMRADLRNAVLGGAVAAPATETWIQPTAASATTIMPPIANGSPTATMAQSKTGTELDEEAARKAKRKKIGIIVGIASAAVIIILAIASWFVLSDTESSEMVEIPSLKGMTQEGVRTTLSDLGLTMTMTPGASSQTVAEGLFLKSTPAPGTKVAKGTKVKVTFSTGPGDTTVPSLEGLTQKQALEALKAAGLKLGEISSVDSGKVDKDKVVSSSPAAGEPVKKGDSVDLEIASGKVLIPSSLQGGSVDALQKFAAENRVSVTITEEQSASAAPGTVLSLDKAGHLVALGTQLRATVAVQPAPEPTPTDTNTASPSPSTP